MDAQVWNTTIGNIVVSVVRRDRIYSPSGKDSYYIQLNNFETTKSVYYPGEFARQSDAIDAALPLVDRCVDAWISAQYRTGI